jgi:hypothetical protein
VATHASSNLRSGRKIIAQNRNDSQSIYQLDYVQAGVGSGPLSFAWWSGARGWLGTAALLLFLRLALLRRSTPDKEPTS